MREEKPKIRGGGRTHAYTPKSGPLSREILESLLNLMRDARKMRYTINITCKKRNALIVLLVS